MKMKLVSIVCILFVFLSNLWGQDPYKSLSRIGNTTISEYEFLERYELTPVFGKHRKGENHQAENRLRFLYTLIAEKLWSLEAREQKLDTAEAMQIAYESFLKMFVRDYLYKKEVKEKIAYSDAELLTAIQRNATTVYVNYLISDDEEEIYDLFNLLKQGIHFDSILVESPEFLEQESPIEIVFGQMDETIEDILFNLKKDEFTSPVFTPDGWYIFRLTNRIQQLGLVASPTDENYQKAKQILELRKERYRYIEFMKEYFNNVSIEASAVLLRSLAVNIATILTNKTARLGDSEIKKLYIEAKDIAELLNSYSADTLGTTFINLLNDPISLRRFILLLGFDGFSVETLEIDDIFKRLNSKTRTFIERELLAREGIKRNYHLTDEVSKQVRMWMDNYLYQYLHSNFIEDLTVSEEDALAYYNSYSKNFKYPMRLNILEILTDSLEIVEYLLKEIEKGSDFKELAHTYTKREALKSRGGEYGLSPIHTFGEMGRIAANLSIDEVYGPIQLPEGFAIIKLIEKYEEGIYDKNISYEKIKDQLIKELTFAKTKLKVAEYTADLAIKFGIDIDADNFNSLKTTGLNSFGIRFLGFGGRLTAAPLLPPQEDWLDIYFRKKNHLP